MQITRQKIYSTLRKAGYTATKFSRSGMVRGWGSWSTGIQVDRNYNTDAWIVMYNFGDRHGEHAELVNQLQAIQKILLDAGIKCYPNTQETALIIGDPNA